MPEGYNNWMEKNAERIAKAKSLPYFIRDNVKYAEEATGLGLQKSAHKFGGGNKLKNAILKEGTILNAMYNEDVTHPIRFTDDVKDNNIEIAKALGVKVPTKTMMHHVANCGNVNPDIDFVGGEDNCALCSFT